MKVYEDAELTKPETIFDLEWIFQRSWPHNVSGGEEVKFIDLFCGCGGMTVGVLEALRNNGLGANLTLALDNNKLAINVLSRNLEMRSVPYRSHNIEELVSADLRSSPNLKEQKTSIEYRGTQIIVAGPPCQGHSNLNNHTRRSDPRNSLYLNTVRFIELIRPKIAIIENVSSVISDTLNVTSIAEKTLKDIGYTVHSKILDASNFGLAQKRKRHFQIAVLKENIDLDLEPYSEASRCIDSYINDLTLEYRFKEGIFYTPSTPNATNARRINFLFDNGLYDLPNEQRPTCHRDTKHSYNSCYGRMRWNQPSQTITSGFGSMGQGRYIHPDQQRVITPHEAARLQGMPDFYSFDSVTSRVSLQQMIANLVPPKLIAIILDCLIKNGALR